MVFRAVIGMHLIAALIGLASVAAAAPSTFQITEVFSSVGASTQFIRLTETEGLNGQHHFAGLTLTATHDGISKVFTFTQDLPSEQTAHLSIVVAAPGFLGVRSDDGSYSCCYRPDLATLPTGFVPTSRGTIDFAGVDRLTYDYLPSDGLAALYRDGSMSRATVPGGPGRCAPYIGCPAEYWVELGCLDDCPTPASISPAFTGVWFDPAQSGHGLILEVLPGNRFSAMWLAFNPAGTAQSWFEGVGTYEDYSNTVTVPAVELPSGGRWIPTFDSSQITRNTWGSLTFSFHDCNHAKVDFNSVAGYGSGTLNLTRLTMPAGLACR